MKFDVGEKVRVKNNDTIGIVQECRHVISFKNGKRDERISYQISVAGNFTHYNLTYLEEELELVKEFSDDFEIGLLGLLIDVNLLLGNIDLTKKLYNEKLKIESQGSD